MLLTFHTIPFLFACAAAALLALFVCWCAASRRFPLFSESLLAASAGLFFAITAEVRGLSLLPVTRPLDWLPLFHCAVFMLIAAVFQLRIGTAMWADPLRNARKSAVALWRESDLLVRAGAVVTVLLLAANLVYGIAQGLFAWDELSYHGPQAIQAFQDGRLAPLDSTLPWTYMYPKGAAVIWAWTMFFTRGDTLFHAVQLAFGLQLLLAAYVLARRMGAGRPCAICAVFALAWMPLFLQTTTMASADIGVAAAAVGMMALAAPAPGAGATPVSRFFAALFLAQAALIKMPVIPVLLAAAGVIYAAVTEFRNRKPAALRVLAASRSLWAGAAVIAISFFQYVQSWVEHGNPLYPIRVSFLGRVLFPGFVPPVEEFVTTHTSHGALAKGSLIRAYHAVWTDWYANLNSDSAANIGPVVALAVLLLFAAFAIWSIRTRSLWNSLFAGVTIAGALVPAAYHPRYGIPITALMVVGAVVFIAQGNGETRAALRSAFIFAAACALPFVCHDLYLSAKYVRNINHGAWLFRRATIFQETVQMGEANTYPTPEMIRAIRTTGHGKLLAWNVTCFHALMWNRDYSNRTLYLSGTRLDRFPGSPDTLSALTSGQARAWTAEIARLRPDRVLVYSNSDYARILASLKSPAYSVFYRDPDARGRGAMTLFERVQ